MRPEEQLAAELNLSVAEVVRAGRQYHQYRAAFDLYFRQEAMAAGIDMNTQLSVNEALDRHRRMRHA